MAIEIRGLRKSYEDFSVTLDLSVKEGETLVLAGPSGCGKTTALSLIAGIIQAEAGDILIDGEDIGELPPWKRSISVVFQDLALFPHLSAGKNIAYGPFIHGISRAERRRIVTEVLGIVKLSGYENRRIDTLSGGERQRVAIARALAARPRALLLDEPFSSLDAPLRRSLREEFRLIPSRTAVPCIFVTHDREEAAALGDRIALMSSGRIVETGTPRELFLSPKTEFGARFFGAGLVLDCTILETGQNGTLVSSPLGKLRVPAADDMPTWDPAGSLLFVPRDALTVHPPAAAQPASGEAACTAVYRGSGFTGDRLSLELELPGGTLCTVETGPRAGLPQKDSTVILRIDEGLIRFVR
ncbi:Fe(3+) ions import ATP-binding protein FbpC [Treponema primitia ZAS-2]|uniref:Fe(3+) ions import ATP-binding protein FbpC n=1 Tax=Treponema primitia (strain ATCC BAA-887 / DSM 12427 / ZAS-2) TaxID=545694 RepID=F5YKZ2_TREPZ|nr:ABC transporter ATP-binding protein [Treponema primitia]AEF84254.1 Fe(3+) ions import ATP-binding protein FbpC [Treponema primitia ZAS-2]